MWIKHWEIFKLKCILHSLWHWRWFLEVRMIQDFIVLIIMIWEWRLSERLYEVRNPLLYADRFFLLSFVLQDCKHDHELTVFENVLATPRGKSLKKKSPAIEYFGMYWAPPWDKAQRHEISLRVLKNISRVSSPFELFYDEFKVTKCCTKTFCLCWVLRSKIAFMRCVTFSNVLYVFGLSMNN